MPHAMKPKLIVTLAYYLAFTLLGLTIAADGPALLKLAEHTSSPLDRINLIFVFGSLGYLAGSYISGRLYDRVSGHQFMAGVIILLGITAGLVPVATSLLVLIIVILAMGAFKGALDVGCNTLLLWVHNEKAGPFMNGLHAFFGLGAFIAPLVFARVIAVTGDIHWLYWSFTIISFPIALFIWNLPSPQARAVPDEHRDNPLPLLPVAIMVLCFTLYVGAEVGYANWIYTYAVQLKLGTEVTSAYLTSAFWGFFMIGRLVGVWISTRLKPITILYLDFAGCILSLGLILLFSDSATILWIGSILLGISCASIFPTLLTLAEERMHVTGTMTGWFFVGASIGGMALPWMVGESFVRIGAGAMMTIILVSVILNLFALVLFTKVPYSQRAERL
jgi:FHS family Na+ dependent glucose MFS transporter 1